MVGVLISSSDNIFPNSLHSLYGDDLHPETGGLKLGENRGSKSNSHPVDTTPYNPGGWALRKLYDPVKERLNDYKLHFSRISGRVKELRPYKWIKRNEETLRKVGKGLKYFVKNAAYGSLVSLLTYFPRVERRVGANITRIGFPFSLKEICEKATYPPEVIESPLFLENIFINAIIWSIIVGAFLYTYKSVKEHKSK